eukprot:Sspe_Gene.47106::Locus_23778_Transcript_3_3_Confidence_0.600_Length_893::g.47106::m.47106
MSGKRQRRKPFGYDMVMSIPPSFLIITLCIMGFIFWYQNRQLDMLVGSEAQLSLRRVIDGDQFLANTEDGYLIKVRLRGVDAPEPDQPYGRESTAFLTRLLTQAHTDIVTYIFERDFEGRYIADVFTQTGVSATFVYVQEVLVKEGLAWHNGGFDRRGLKEMMMNATKDKIGLWADPDAAAPWKFRRQKEREAKQRHSKRETPRKRDERRGQERRRRR